MDGSLKEDTDVANVYLIDEQINRQMEIEY